MIRTTAPAVRDRISTVLAARIAERVGVAPNEIFVRLFDSADEIEVVGTDDVAAVEAEVAAHTGAPTDREQAMEAREDNLAEAISTLRQWAADAAGTTVTQGNAVQVLNVVVDRLGVFFDRFADLLENR